MCVIEFKFPSRAPTDPRAPARMRRVDPKVPREEGCAVGRRGCHNAAFYAGNVQIWHRKSSIGLSFQIRRDLGLQYAEPISKRTVRWAEAPVHAQSVNLWQPVRPAAARRAHNRGAEVSEGRSVSKSLAKSKM